MKYDITTYKELRACLESSFCRKADLEDPHLLRWVFGEPNEDNLVHAQVSLTDERLDDNDEKHLTYVELFGKEQFERLQFSGFPYNQIPKYKNIASSKIRLIPVTKKWHGCADRKTQYTLKTDEDSKFLRFWRVMQCEERKIWIPGPLGIRAYSSEDLTANVNAILTAQRIMKGIEGAIQVDVDEICDEILKKR